MTKTNAVSRPVGSMRSSISRRPRPAAAFPILPAPLVNQHHDLRRPRQADARHRRRSTFPSRTARRVTIDLTGTTQLATAYTPMNIAVNGNAPSSISGIDIDKDGTVYATYENGSRVAAYRIPLADVPSPDNLQPVRRRCLRHHHHLRRHPDRLPDRRRPRQAGLRRAGAVERRHGVGADRDDRGAARLHRQLQGRARPARICSTCS